MTSTASTLPQLQKHIIQQTQTYSGPSILRLLFVYIKETMRAQLSQFSLLTLGQHSFLLRSSTLTNLIVAKELVTAWVDEGSAVQLIYLDFSRYALPSTP